MFETNVHPQLGAYIGMLDNVPPLSTLKASLAFLTAKPIARAPLPWYHIPVPAQVDDMVNEAITMAKRSRLTTVYLKKKLTHEGVNTFEYVAAMILFTMGPPLHPHKIYAIFTGVLNQSGTRVAIAEFKPYLKLLTVAIDLVPRDCKEYWFTGKEEQSFLERWVFRSPHTAPLYRGVDWMASPSLTLKFTNPNKYFFFNNLQSFAAPTSMTTNPRIAEDFSKGMGYQFYGVEGVRLKAWDLSVFPEDEVLPPFPCVFRVKGKSVTPPGLTVSMQATNTSMRYLSGSNSAPGAFVTLVTLALVFALLLWLGLQVVGMPSVVMLTLGVMGISSSVGTVGKRLSIMFVMLIVLASYALSMWAPSKAGEHLVPKHNGYLLYCIGGRTEEEVLSSGEVYNSTTREWAHLPKMRTARHSFGMAVVNRVVYTFGGVDHDGRLLASGESYDPRTPERKQKWVQTMGTMNIPRRDFGVVVIDEMIYAMGGEDSNLNVLSSVEAYNPNEKFPSWSVVGSMKEPRMAFGVAVVNGRLVYCYGGINKKKGLPLSTGEVYNPQSTFQSYEPLPDMDIGRSDFSMVYMNNMVYLAPGASRGETFDTTSKGWSETTISRSQTST